MAIQGMVWEALGQNVPSARTPADHPLSMIKDGLLEKPPWKGGNLSDVLHGTGCALAVTM